MDNMTGVKHFHPICYEDLYTGETSSLLTMLEEETGGKRAKECKPFDGKGVVKHEDVPNEFAQWMNEFVD
jgi:hypothetical protein